LSEKVFVEIDNDIAEIARINALIDTLSRRHELSETITFHIKFALDELLTNIISYSFPDAGKHKIAVRMEIEGDAFEAEVIDDGIAFNPLDEEVPDLGQSVDERQIGGLGVHFIRTVMDRAAYRRSDGRNHFTMIKKVPVAPAKQG
jgi:serine/threonine-protein kinase RsbW